ncbi:MAG: cytochrome P450 [Polyangiaceae bacterium]|nr:cytochrome P450 [Polyangiaceae bacterium]
MREIVDAIVGERRVRMQQALPVPNDLLQVMLVGKDRETGQRLSDENIRNQLITFLAAGHETTSGALAYALYFLCKHPHVASAVAEEVDAVLGRDFSYRPAWEDLERLELCSRVLKEALRLKPTAPAFFKVATRDEVVAGGYAVPKGSRVLVVLPALHTNPRFWGEGAERFDPDRFLPDAVRARHPHAYHPFGLGMRSCIGFQFAIVESKLVLARLFQRYRLALADPEYVLRDKETLTIKPDGLALTLERRQEGPARQTVEAGGGMGRGAGRYAATSAPALTILFGSVMGTAQDLASRLASDARAAGHATHLAELDSVTDRPAADSAVPALPTTHPIVFVASTYNGAPPDNAERFARWLASPDRKRGSLSGVRYAVIGCGNSQWHATYQRFPRLIDERLAELGAKRLAPFGECDADRDFDAGVEAWRAAAWPVLAREIGPASSAGDEGLRFTVEMANYAGADRDAVKPCCYPVHADARTASVQRQDDLLTATSERSTVHIEIGLPEGVSYEAGDHLGVFPENPFDLVERAAVRCEVRLLDVVIVRDRVASKDEPSPVPIGVPLFVRDLLTHHVDLSGPVARRELRALASSCDCPPERTALDRLATEAGFKNDVADARLTIVDVLERFQSIRIDLATLLSLRPVLKPRYYSISSSPRSLPRACSITVGVHAFEGGAGGVSREGLCSTWPCPQTVDTAVMQPVYSIASVPL